MREPTGAAGYRFTVENSVCPCNLRSIGAASACIAERLIEECETRGYRQMIAVIGDFRQCRLIGVHTRTDSR